MRIRHYNIKATVIIFTLFSIAVSCSDRPVNPQAKSSKDTVVRKMVIREDSNGKINEAIYFVMRNNDTSQLRCYFSKSPEGVEINIYDEHNLSYREEKDELKLIIHEASKDFALRSLVKIWDIPLIVMGDLAIELTKQLPAEYARKPLNNLNVSSFLLTSKLTKDLNELLMPYGKKIKNYVVEKVGFTDSSFILKARKIETPISKIPSKILVAQVWPVIENYVQAE